MSKVTICRYQDAPVAMQRPEGRKMFTSDRIGIVHLTLKPGETVSRHINPFDVVFYVLSGEGTLEADGESYKATENTCLEVAPGVERGWINTGTSDLTILVIKNLS
jgi:quercetin dioxygenase-like cupin family protein